MESESVTGIYPDIQGNLTPSILVFAKIANVGRINAKKSLKFTSETSHLADN